MSNTVINIYGDLNINLFTIGNEGSFGEKISKSIKDSNQSIIDDEPKTNYNDSCEDYYGRWSNDAERDAWRRFYRANSYC